MDLEIINKLYLELSHVSTSTPKREHDLEDRVRFYKKRCELLQKVQHTMRDPERTLVCDILANGQLLPDPNGIRYPPLQTNHTESEKN